MRLLVWIFGIAVSLIPLILVAASVINKGTTTFWEAFSNEELLVVAFTVGAVAAFEALIATRTRPFSAIIGAITLILTFFSIGIYMLLKFKIAQWSPEATVLTIQSLCAGTVLTSFLCETQS